ncbi:MAG TPA: DUF5602 domain-containing protein [Gemmatimonadaceae bacterium]|nr:DUF5602 domain-containing protein [Gemmatimonadaceae bacterium]
MHLSIIRPTARGLGRDSSTGRVRGRALVIMAAALAVAACSSDSTSPDAAVEVDGPPVSVGNGTAQSFIMQNGKVVTTVGIKLSDGALDGLPAEMSEWKLAMPSSASAPPWDHMTLDWNPQGHEPAPIYGVPHFDFHFYMIPDAEQAAIAGGPDNTPVESQFVPRDYASQVISVPGMGVHWADTLSAEFHGTPFTKTFIYGFYQGQMVFVEPMVTRDFLASHPDVSSPVKQAESYQTPGSYPTSYSVRYDASQHATFIELDSLAVH